MKFLVKMESIGSVLMSPKEGLQLTSATLDYWNSIIESGKAVGGSFVEMNGGGGILEVESLEELEAILGGAPNAGFVRYEVHGLTDLENSKKVIRKQLEALKKV